MLEIVKLRKQLRKIAAESNGNSPNNNIAFRGGLTALKTGVYEERLEQDARGSFQCLDPSSPDFGKVFFISGLHVPGDPNHPIGPNCG